MTIRRILLLLWRSPMLQMMLKIFCNKLVQNILCLPPRWIALVRLILHANPATWSHHGRTKLSDIFLIPYNRFRWRGRQRQRQRQTNGQWLLHRTEYLTSSLSLQSCLSSWLHWAAILFQMCGQRLQSPTKFWLLSNPKQNSNDSTKVLGIFRPYPLSLIPFWSAASSLLSVISLSWQPSPGPGTLGFSIYKPLRMVSRSMTHCWKSGQSCNFHRRDPSSEVPRNPSVSTPRLLINRCGARCQNCLLMSISLIRSSTIYCYVVWYKNVDFRYQRWR